MNVSRDAAFDVVAVDAVESRAATGVFLEEREKTFHAALFARFFGSGWIGGGFSRARGLPCSRRHRQHEQVNHDSPNPEPTSQS